MLPRPILAVTALALASAAGAPLLPSAVAPKPPRTVDHSRFDRILRERVRDERVDYLLLRKHDYDELLAYLGTLRDLDPSRLPRREQLALYFNLYNAAMIRAVVERFDATYTPAEDSYAVFDEPLIELGDRKLSLNGLEHDLLRKEFDEPRLHVALVCAARSCPPLLPRAYRAADLDAVLEANMRRFLADPTRNRIDVPARRLELSRIFHWYAKDFGGAREVPEYVDDFVDADVRGFETSFLEYDWTLNVAPPAEGRWVRVGGDPATVRGDPGRGSRSLGTVDRDQVFEVVDERDGWLRIERPFGEGPAWIAAADTLPY